MPDLQPRVPSFKSYSYGPAKIKTNFTLFKWAIPFLQMLRLTSTSYGLLFVVENVNTSQRVEKISDTETPFFVGFPLPPEKDFPVSFDVPLT